MLKGDRKVLSECDEISLPTCLEIAGKLNRVDLEPLRFRNNVNLECASLLALWFGAARCAPREASCHTPKSGAEARPTWLRRP